MYSVFRDVTINYFVSMAYSLFVFDICIAFLLAAALLWRYV